MSQTYTNAAKIIQEFWNKNGSLKTLTFSHDFDKKTQLYALAFKTLKATDVLNALFYQSSLVKCNIKNRALLYVMLYDHIFGKGITCGGKVAHIIKENDQELKTLFEKLKKTTKNNMCSKIDDLLEHTNESSVPKFIRVNTCITSDAAVIKEFKKTSVDLVKDTDIDHLYKIESHSDIHDHPLVSNGSVVIQSKPSCFPAHILLSNLSNIDDDYTVIDACAAPGNKTTHCSALLNKKGHVYACDKDEKRFELLQNRVSQMKCSNVTCLNQDFLQLSESDEIYNKASAILLDPSCSGTGMANNVLDMKAPDVFRIKKLSTFQLKALIHAMSFPNVQRITYSTCSILKDENENVVKTALLNDLQENGTNKWKLACALPQWTTRGQPIEGLTEDQQNCLVRSNIDGPLGQGFFVALFIRADAEDENEESLETFRKTIPVHNNEDKQKNLDVQLNARPNQHKTSSHKKVRSNTIKRYRKVAL